MLFADEGRSWVACSRPSSTAVTYGWVRRRSPTGVSSARMLSIRRIVSSIMRRLDRLELQAPGRPPLPGDGLPCRVIYRRCVRAGQCSNGLLYDIASSHFLRHRVGHLKREQPLAVARASIPVIVSRPVVAPEACPDIFCTVPRATLVEQIPDPGLGAGRGCGRGFGPGARARDRYDRRRQG